MDNINYDTYLLSVLQFVTEGREVVIPVKGNSMLPFIVGGVDHVALSRCNEISVGDIVLANTDEKGYVIHRIDNIGEDGRVSLLGDGNLQMREHCSRNNVLAMVTHVIRPGGKRVSMQSRKAVALGRMWRMLLPVRKYLLKIYKKIH
jgi:SOS-response transcriptional repressor LexA